MDLHIYWGFVFCHCKKSGGFVLADTAKMTYNITEDNSSRKGEEK